MVSAGRILILPQGTWDNATMYNMLDLVAYNGISWLCKRQCVGITPNVSATEYWQQFGSSAPIASTSVAGLVMPDGQTITIDTTTGAIAVPTATAAKLGLVKPDGTSITINANGVISSAGGNLSNLGDVAINELANGQVLIWNQTNQKWQNGTIAGALSALSDVTISSATDGQILVYDTTEQKWKNATAQATLSNSTKPIQTKVVKDMASDVIETLSAGASQAYSAGDLIMCSNGKWYKAITDISQNQTLTAGGNVEETSQRALNTNLTQNKIGKFSDTTYVPVDSIAYDETNQVLGLKVDGADTVIPFKKGGCYYIGIGSGATACYVVDGDKGYSITGSNRTNIVNWLRGLTLSFADTFNVGASTHAIAFRITKAGAYIYGTNINGSRIYNVGDTVDMYNNCLVFIGKTDPFA